MKKQIVRCERCGKETIHIIKKRLGHRGQGYRVKREIKHCCECGLRNIKNSISGNRIVDYG